MSVEGLSEPFFMNLLGSEALTLLFIDQEVHIGVNRDDYHVGQDVSAANEHQRLRVLHGNSFRLISQYIIGNVSRGITHHLHHHQDNHQVSDLRR